VTDLQQMKTALDKLPPEAFLEGPPDDGDLLLARTLGQVRAESSRRNLIHRSLLAAVAAAAVVAAVAGGVAVGRVQGQPPPVAAPASTAPSAAPEPAGTQFASGVDAVTGARMTVKVVPASGWVRVNAAVSGVAEGEACRLWVLAGDGTRVLAGSWLVSAAGAAEGTTLDGTALVAPAQVAGVEVDTVTGRPVVSVLL
jgi:hypothetical protein